jgi:hypothetical protein
MQRPWRQRVLAAGGKQTEGDSSREQQEKLAAHLQLVFDASEVS